MTKPEGVAAPLEPTRQEFEKWANDPERRLHLDWDGERYELYEVELCWQAYRTAAAVSKNLQPDWLTIAAMMCLNIDMMKDGQDVLPSELAKYMADIHKQIEAGKSPR